MPHKEPTAQDLAYEKFWNALTLKGDPLYVPNKFRTGFNAGWEASLAHAPATPATPEISTLEVCRRQLENILYCCNQEPPILVDSIRVYAEIALKRVVAEAAPTTPDGLDILLRGFIDDLPIGGLISTSEVRYRLKELLPESRAGQGRKP